MKQKGLFIGRSKEDPILLAIKRGQFSRKRKPNIIKVLPLSKAVNSISNQILAKEVAFALSKEHSDRLLEERYRVVYNIVVVKDWSNIAVVKLSKEILDFKDLVCIDYTPVYDYDFKQQHKLFISILIEELTILGRI